MKPFRETDHQRRSCAEIFRVLRPGGKMILPLGPHNAVQKLVLVEKSADGTSTIRELLPVRFVPVTGDH